MTFDTLVSVAGLMLVACYSSPAVCWCGPAVTSTTKCYTALRPEDHFPAANSAAVAAPEFQAMRQYGGQQLTTGAQAEVYADHFIANHL